MIVTSKGLEQALPATTRPFPLPPSRQNAHPFSQPPRSWPQQTPDQSPVVPVTANLGDPSEPPLKKAKLENALGFQANRGAAGAIPKAIALETAKGTKSPARTEQHEEKSRAHPNTLFPLRPGRCKPLRKSDSHRPLAIERAARKDAVPITAYVPEPPSCAPRFHEDGSSDFFPWKGHHPEDVLNEMTTKQGFYDRVQASQSESSTARPPIWSSLKHKSGLQILSSLFISALDQRQTHRTITAASTFKPPPRVTLTDTKREAWLRDLANPLISLRRLSRTIPYGIRGRILLEQCLGKDIPILRAVWLAKCVGANEIRAFKRKGTGGVFTVGGEAKWIKDWTNNIEQFLESIMASCGNLEWKTKIDYALRLASHLYSEHLLDRDHYLDWLICSIEVSNLDHLPIWLLVQQFHERELLQHRKRGRRLAIAVLEHLRIANLSSANQEVYQPVLQELMRLASRIMLSAPACLVLPDSWNKYRDTLKSCLNVQDTDNVKCCFEDILLRNNRLQNDAPEQRESPVNSVTKRLISLLDTEITNLDYGEIAERCLRITWDGLVLVKTCIEWSCTIHRYGLFRTYASARLFRVWNRCGIELQGPLQELLDSSRICTDLSRQSFYRLYATLVSSKHFSVGRYLQWLMARGTLRTYEDHKPERPTDVGLLFELPLHNLPSHTLNLRQILVSSVRRNYDGEESRLAFGAKVQIRKSLPELCTSISESSDLSMDAMDLTYLSQTIKSDLARWVRQIVIERLKKHSDLPDIAETRQQKQATGGRALSIMSSSQYVVLRQILEDIGDFNVFADILDMISDQVQGHVLVAVTDTINFYFDVFNAIGAADQLFEKLCGNLRTEQNQESEHCFLESLVDLGSRLPKAAEGLPKLRSRLLGCAQRNSAVACSPISDNMVEAVHSTEPTFADEIDHILASGNSMDGQTLSRIFGTLVGHLAKCLNESDHQIIRLSQLLASLRRFAPESFDLLFRKWLYAFLRTDVIESLFKLLVHVVCCKVVSLAVVMELMMCKLDTHDDLKQELGVATTVLMLLVKPLSGRMITADYRVYRLRDQVKNVLHTSPATMIAILGKAVKAREASESIGFMEVQSEADDELIISLTQLAHMRLYGDQGTDPDSLSSMQDATNIVLVLRKGKISEGLKFRKSIVSIFSNVNEFNILLSILRIKAILSSATVSSQGAAQALSHIMMEMISSSQNDLVNLWASLISELPAIYSSSIRASAESAALSWATSKSEPIPTDESPPIPKLMFVIEASAFAVPVNEASALIELITETLTSIVQADESHNRQSLRPDWQSQRIDVLIRLLVVHQSTIRHPKYSPHVLLRLLMALSLLLMNPFLTSHPTLSHRIFDTLCFFSDSISDDTRARCVHTLREIYRVRDPRLRFIFGYSDSDCSEWLHLVNKASPAADVKPGAGAGPGAAAMTSRPYPLRKWEMMQDATPVATENDTSLSLTLFGSRSSVL